MEKLNILANPVLSLFAFVNTLVLPYCYCCETVKTNTMTVALN